MFIVDASARSHHLDLGPFFLVIPAPFFAAGAVVLASRAEPGRVVSRTLQTWIDLALGTLVAGVVGTVLAPFVAPDLGALSMLGALDVAVACLGLIGYIVAFVGTLIVDHSSRQ
jgi:hypothetical protein